MTLANRFYFLLPGSTVEFNANAANRGRTVDAVDRGAARLISSDGNARADTESIHIQIKWAMVFTVKTRTKIYISIKLMKYVKHLCFLLTWILSIWPSSFHLDSCRHYRWTVWLLYLGLGWPQTGASPRLLCACWEEIMQLLKVYRKTHQCLCTFIHVSYFVKLYETFPIGATDCEPEISGSLRDLSSCWILAMPICLPSKRKTEMSYWIFEEFNTCYCNKAYHIQGLFASA